MTTVWVIPLSDKVESLNGKSTMMCFSWSGKLENFNYSSRFLCHSQVHDEKTVFIWKVAWFLTAVSSVTAYRASEIYTFCYAEAVKCSMLPERAVWIRQEWISCQVLDDTTGGFGGCGPKLPTRQEYPLMWITSVWVVPSEERRRVPSHHPLDHLHAHQKLTERRK